MFRDRPDAPTGGPSTSQAQAEVVYGAGPQAERMYYWEGKWLRVGFWMTPKRRGYCTVHYQINQRKRYVHPALPLRRKRSHAEMDLEAFAQRRDLAGIDVE